MKVLLAVLMFCCCASSYAAPSPTFELMSSAGERADVGVIFDGAPSSRASLPEIMLSAPAMPTGGIAADPILPYPTLSEHVVRTSGEKTVIESPMTEDWQWNLLLKSVNTFAGTASGKSIADFFNNANIEIVWSNKGFTSSDPYAYTRPPGNTGPSVIYLNTHYRELLLNVDDPAFTLLSSIITHETVHQQDYESLQLKAHPKGNSVDLLLELHALSTEVYVYEQLRYAKKTPPIDKETEELQWLRLYADIFRYVNGGPRPRGKDYPQLEKTQGGTLETYIRRVADTKKRGWRSLFGVVEDLNNLQVALEAPPQPTTYEYATQTGKYQELMQYNVLIKSIDSSFREFEAWKISVTPASGMSPVSTQPQQPPHIPQQSNQPGTPSSPGNGGQSGNEWTHPPPQAPDFGS